MRRANAFASATLPGQCGAELLDQRQDRHEQVVRAVVVARGQLVVQHVVQPLKPQGLLLGQAADRRGILGDERVLAQAGHRQPAERKARGRDRPVRAGWLVVHHTAVEDEQVAAARVIRRAADKIPALSPAHEHDLDQIVVRMHDARVGGGLFVRPADRKQPRRPGQAERRLVFLFDKALDNTSRPSGSKNCGFMVA